MVRILAVVMLAVAAIAHPAMEVTAGFARAKAAKASKDPGPLTFTFVDAVPASITLGSSYTGPADPSLAEYDAGDGVWQTYTSKTITMQGQYVAFRGDWRDSSGAYAYMFSSTFLSYNLCSISGELVHAAHTNKMGYREMFRNCTGIKEIKGLIFPPITGTIGRTAFLRVFQTCGNLELIPDGFLDTREVSYLDDVTYLQHIFSGTKLKHIPEHTLCLPNLISPTYRPYFTDTFRMSGHVTNDFMLVIGDGVNITLADTSIINGIFRGQSFWKGTVMWGDQKIYEAFPEPLTRIQAFDGCTSMPDYDTLHPNWK